MKPQHQVFIIKMIKYGDKVQAYRAAYPKCTNDETARKSAERILRHHPEVAAELEEATAYMRQRTYAEAYREHIERQKTPLLSMMKRREILAQIATCQMKVGRFVKDGGRYIMLFEDPRPRDIMQAIQTDAKMEDACNRMRNYNDPFFSQFNIYIDGRPCDQPHLPPDPNLPPGIYMLPRRRKNQNHLSSAGGGVSSADGGGTLAPEKIQIEEPGIISEQNTTQHCPPPWGDRGALAQNQNPGIKTEHLPHQGGEIALSPATCPDIPIVIGIGSALSPAGGGVSSADGGGALEPEKNQIEKPGIKTEHYHTEDIHHTSPPPGDLGVSLEPGKSQIEGTGIISEHLSHQGGEIQITSPPPWDLGVPLAPEQNTQHCPPPVRTAWPGGPGGDRGADPLAASFYKQEQQARASAPPPHILTPEEVKELDEEYARKRRNEKPVKPSTFGKMYFKENGIDYDNLE